MGNVGRVFIPFPYVAPQPVTNRAGSIVPSDFHLFELWWGVLQRTMLQRTVFNQQNQDATANTDATTNAEEYYRST